MRKILGLVLVFAMMGVLVGCSTTTPEVKNTFPQPKGLSIEGIVYGTNQDQNPDEPGDTISGATVVLTGGGQTLTASSGASGKFSFVNLPQSSYSEGYMATITKSGFQRRILTGIPLGNSSSLTDNSTTVIEVVLNNDPVVLSISPEPGAVIEAASQKITVEFNEEMDKSSVRPSLAPVGVRTFAIADTQTLTTTWSADGKTLSITTGVLLPNLFYLFMLDPENRAKDEEGNLLDTTGGGGGLPETVFNNSGGSADKYYRTKTGGIPGQPTGLQVNIDNVVLPAKLDYTNADKGTEWVGLNWQAPTSGGPISGYRIYVSNDSSGSWHLVESSTDTVALLQVDDINNVIMGGKIGAPGGIDPVAMGNAAFINYKVYFRVVAFNADGESSAATADAKDATSPILSTSSYNGAALSLGNVYVLPATTDDTERYIAFQEPVNLTDAGNASNYKLDGGLTVSSSSVKVMTSYMSDIEPVASNFGGNGAYTVIYIKASGDLTGRTLTVSGIKDLAGNAVGTTGNTLVL